MLFWLLWAEEMEISNYPHCCKTLFLDCKHLFCYRFDSGRCAGYSYGRPGECYRRTHWRGDRFFSSRNKTKSEK